MDYEFYQSKHCRFRRYFATERQQICESHCTQKIKLSIKDFFSKWDQIRFRRLSKRIAQSFMKSIRKENRTKTYLNVSQTRLKKRICSQKKQQESKTIPQNISVFWKRHWEKPKNCILHYVGNIQIQSFVWFVFSGNYGPQKTPPWDMFCAVYFFLNLGIYKKQGYSWTLNTFL